MEKRKLNKKAQLKIQQMAFMLIALTIFFVMVGLMYLGIKMAGIRENANLLEEKKAIEIASRIANSAEFSCGDVFFGKINCIDSDKIVALTNIKKYEEFWEVDKIQIRLLSVDEKRKCNTANYPNCNLIEVYSKGSESGISYSNFVSVCRKEQDSKGNKYDKCELGLIMINPIEK